MYGQGFMRTMTRRWAVPLGVWLTGCVAATSLGGCAKKSESVDVAGGTTSRTASSAPASRSVGDKWVPVRRDSLRHLTPAVGTFRARQTTRLGPQVSGRVAAVKVDVGDVVKQGQVVVQLDPAFFEIEVAQAQAAVKAVKAVLSVAEVNRQDSEREMKRQSGLFQRDAATAKEKDDAALFHQKMLLTKDGQQALLDEAERRLAYAGQRLKESQILAPYDGVITRRMVDTGEPVTSMPPSYVVEIQETGTLYLEFSLPQELLGIIKVGAPLDYEVEGVKDGTGKGQVAVVFPSIDEATRSFRCRTIIESKDRKFRPGLLARVWVVDRSVDSALIVPKAALDQTATGWRVMVSAGGTAVSRPVTVGLMTDDAAEITGGLKEGEQVLVPQVIGK